MSDGIGENIRRIRKEKKITQKKLAEMTGLTNVVINYYEHGAKRRKNRCQLPETGFNGLLRPLSGVHAGGSCGRRGKRPRKAGGNKKSCQEQLRRVDGFLYPAISRDCQEQ